MMGRTKPKQPQDRVTRSTSQDEILSIGDDERMIRVVVHEEAGKQRIMIHITSMLGGGYIDLSNDDAKTICDFLTEMLP